MISFISFYWVPDSRGLLSFVVHTLQSPLQTRKSTMSTRWRSVDNR